MSAETLRRAASRIRHDVEFGQAHGDDSFLLAVADWLDSSADVIDGQTEVGKPTWIVPPGCFAVARAYLGESA